MAGTWRVASYYNGEQGASSANFNFLKNLHCCLHVHHPLKQS